MRKMLKRSKLGGILGIDWPPSLLEDKCRKGRLISAYPWLEKIQPWTQVPAPSLHGSIHRSLWIIDDGYSVYYAMDNGPGQNPFLYEIQYRNPLEVIIRCGGRPQWIKPLADCRAENEERVAQGFAPRNDL